MDVVYLQAVSGGSRVILFEKRYYLYKAITTTGDQMTFSKITSRVRYFYMSSTFLMTINVFQFIKPLFLSVVTSCSFQSSSLMAAALSTVSNSSKRESDIKRSARIHHFFLLLFIFTSQECLLSLLFCNRPKKLWEGPGNMKTTFSVLCLFFLFFLFMYLLLFNGSNFTFFKS